MRWLISLLSSFIITVIIIVIICKTGLTMREQDDEQLNYSHVMPKH